MATGKARTIMEKRIRQQLAWKEPAHTDAPRRGADFPYLSREQAVPANWMEELAGSGEPSDSGADTADTGEFEDGAAEDRSHKRARRN